MFENFAIGYITVTVIFLDERINVDTGKVKRKMSIAVNEQN